MTMAAAIESRTADAPAWSKSSRVARIDLLTDLEQAEPVWRSLENQQYLFTPYQRFDFLRHWQRQVGTRHRQHPLIAVAYDQDRLPLLLLPLVLGKTHGIRIARFMGGKHTTFNMGIWDREFVKQASLADLDLLFAAIRRHSATDVVALVQQPLTWRDLPNPFALLSHQPSANACPLLTMLPGAPAAARISDSMRRRLHAKERKLKSLAGYRYHLAVRDGDINRLLDAFFRIKPQRMAAQRLPNVFAEPGVEDFIRDACAASFPDGSRVVEMHALECEGEVIALFAGLADGCRFSMMFNTYTTSERSRHSPGLVLIRHIIDHYAERGYHGIDLGVGSDGYKRLFCKGDESIFDCYVSLSGRGLLAAGGLSAANRLKRLVKQSPALVSLAQAFQHSFR
jgi:CelD/BcsL family acetyltransferase involved in cellulose biosynthesis